MYRHAPPLIRALGGSIVGLHPKDSHAPQTSAADELNVSQVRTIQSMEDLINETVTMFLVLKQVAKEMHGGGRNAGPVRGILSTLDSKGPMTVPDLAREKHCTRQVVQQHVNRLQEEGVVEFLENPSHKRSKLVSLTDAGRAEVHAMAGREVEALIPIADLFSPEEVETARDTLVRLRRAMTKDTFTGPEKGPR